MSDPVVQIVHYQAKINLQSKGLMMMCYSYVNFSNSIQICVCHFIIPESGIKISFALATQSVNRADYFTVFFFPKEQLLPI